VSGERPLNLLALAGVKVFTGDRSSCGAGMTHEILQTDIEFAKAQIGSNLPDDQVAMALTRRGVDPAAASQLVQDLRNGRPIQPPAAAPEWVSRRRSVSGRSTTKVQDQPSIQPPQPRSTSHRRPSRAAKKKARENTFVLVVAGILACLVVAGFVVFKHRHNSTRDRDESRSESRPAPESNSKSPAPKAPVVLEIQTDGLHLAGALLTREAAWNRVARILGSPSRTNLLAGGTRLIYAYDHYGILVYAEKGAGTDSIVLDFEGLGGTNGATSPFQGSLKIDDQAIKGDTDAKALVGIKQLGLKQPGADAGIFGGQCSGLELIFAYLKTPQRLSLVEISLK